jgi:hypothetical protein
MDFLVLRFWVSVCLVAGYCTQATGEARIVVLPFDDKVELREAWDLSVEVPRWFSASIDTIGGAKPVFGVVSFDSVTAFIDQNGWKRTEYLEPGRLQAIAGHFDARLVVTGTVERFKVIKRAITGDAALGGTHSISEVAVGGGGVPVTAGLQAYTADVRLGLTIHSGNSGKQVHYQGVAVDERDGGLKVWLPVSTENDELNYYYMSKHPFGSEYFHRNVLGAVMKQCSREVREAVEGELESPRGASSRGKEFLEGKILDRAGGDVYINLGSDDNLYLGEELEVLRPERPVVSEAGDTLGWVEVPVATLRVRSIKAGHFARATLVSDPGSIEVGWTVRTKATDMEGREKPK